MSFQQQNSRDMEKPFSLRNYAFMSRQKNIAQSWPFQQKYLKLCLNHGINDVLPPLGPQGFSVDGLCGRSVTGFSLSEKETSDFGKKQGEDYSSIYKTVGHLCEKLARLSLFFDGGSFVCHKQPLTATLIPRTSGNRFSKPQNTPNYKNKYNKGAKMKGRTKKKSMTEILAVAKHCVLDGHGRIFVSGGGSSSSQAQNVEVQRESPGSKAHDLTKDCSLIKKHQRCDDSVTGTAQFSKRTRTMGVSRYRYNECKLKPWSRKNSCKSDETEKPAGGYEKAESQAKGGNKLVNYWRYIMINLFYDIFDIIVS